MTASVCSTSSIAFNPMRILEANCFDRSEFKQTMEITNKPLECSVNISAKANFEKTDSWNCSREMFVEPSYVKENPINFVLEDEKQSGKLKAQKDFMSFSEMAARRASNNIKENINKERLSLGSIPRLLKCFSCERIIKEDHFSEHLIFGAVKCADCQVTINDCQDFQLWAVECSFGNVSCLHTLNYFEDPVKYLTGKLTESKVEHLGATIKTIALLENYVKKLETLKQRQPWKSAIEECNNYLVSVHSSELKKPQTSMIWMSKREVECFGKSKMKDITAHNNTVVAEKEYVKTVYSKNCDSVQHEDLNVSTDIPESELSKRKLHIPVTPDKKSFKKSQIIHKHRKAPSSRSHAIEYESDLELIPVPKDGFYYVSEKPIESCPNCYELLCPSQMEVNINSFLITTKCQCNLTIYITSPRVQVVTDDSLGRDENSKNSKRKKKKHLVGVYSHALLKK